MMSSSQAKLSYEGSAPSRAKLGLNPNKPSPSVADIACIPSIFIKTSQSFFDESFGISAFTKIFFEKLGIIEIGARGH